MDKLIERVAFVAALIFGLGCASIIMGAIFWIWLKGGQLVDTAVNLGASLLFSAFLLLVVIFILLVIEEFKEAEKWMSEQF